MYPVSVMREIASSEQNNMKEGSRVMRLSATMALACVLAVFAGNAIDEWLHTSPLFLLGFLTYAIASSLYMMIKSLGNEL